MGKEILKHYEALMLEKKDIENRSAAIEKELKNYEKGPQIQESVCGGAGGVQRFTVRGFPHSEHKRKRPCFWQGNSKWNRYKKRSKT